VNTSEALPSRDSAILVNISTEKWPPRQRTYFGSLAIRSPLPGEAYAITPIRGCFGVNDFRIQSKLQRQPQDNLLIPKPAFSSGFPEPLVLFRFTVGVL
jgi:hypothetical protein